jgi:choline dehydrogenase
VVVEAEGVGANLHDHPQIEVIFRGTPRLAAETAAWATRTDTAFPGQVVLKARSSRASTEFDIHIWANGGMPLSPTTGWTGGVPFSGSQEAWNWELGVACLTPRSRGRLRLASTNPADPPIIDHGFLSDLDGHDLSVLCEGIRLVRDLTTGTLGDLLGQEVPPTGACNDQPALNSAIRDHCVHYWHPVGTCRMGPAGTSGVVVDKNGRVHGIENVHIGDASVMPTIPRANTNLPTLAVAHRVAAAVAARATA